MVLQKLISTIRITGFRVSSDEASTTEYCRGGVGGLHNELSEDR